MELSEALARISINRLTEFSSLSDVLEPAVIQSCLDSNGVATLRKLKLPMDAMVWAVIEMPYAKHMLHSRSEKIKPNYNDTLRNYRLIIMVVSVNTSLACSVGIHQ